MSAERLREAARVLRERAEDATPGPWEGYYDDSGRPYWAVITEGTGDPVANHDRVGGYEEPHGVEGSDAFYIATMHPGVGLALADWLDNVTACCDECMNDPAAQTTEQFHALRLANLILGDAS